jgi:hypothetical protein
VLVLTLEKLRRGELHEAERIASFVLGIARNAVLDLRRSERRHAPIRRRFTRSRRARSKRPRSWSSSACAAASRA